MSMAKISTKEDGGHKKPSKTVNGHQIPRLDWRLVDSEFDRLHKKMNFTLEACCDTKGDNGHACLRFYSPIDSLLDHDVSGHTIFMNPPWSKAKRFVDHVRQCHASDPKNTKALIVLPKWASFNDITKDLILYEEKPVRQQLFTRSPETDGIATVTFHSSRTCFALPVATTNGQCSLPCRASTSLATPSCSASLDSFLLKNTTTEMAQRTAAPGESFSEF